MNRFLLALIALTVSITNFKISTATILPGMVRDGKTSLYYVTSTGEFGIQPDGRSIGFFEIHSASGIFTADAMLPPGGLGLDINTNVRKSWITFPQNAFTKDTSLGVFAAPGLSVDFLLTDLFAQTGRGLGTEHENIDLVALCCTPLIPRDVNLGDLAKGAQIEHLLTATGDPPLTWSALSLKSGLTPAMAPMLSQNGQFSWNSAGSPLGTYTWDATVTNPTGSATASLTVRLVPEPTTLSLAALPFIAFAIRRTVA